MLINTLPARLVRWFSEQEELADCVFLEAYPGNPAKRPVNATTVTVGSADLTVAPTEQGAQSRTGFASFVTRVHVPSRMGGGRLNDIAARIADALLFVTGLDLGEIGTDPVRYDRNTDTIVLEMRFTVQETLWQTYEWTQF